MWLKLATAFLLFLVASAQVQVQVQNVADVKWMFNKSTNVIVDTYATEDYALFSFLYCDSVRNCDILVRDVTINSGITNEKRCSVQLFSNNELSTRLIKLNTLRNAHVILSYKEHDRAKIKIYDMMNCQVYDLDLAVRLKTFALVTNETTFDVVLCSGDNCVLSYDYRGNSISHQPKNRLFNENFEEAEFYPVSTSPSKGYFVVNKDKYDGTYTFTAAVPNRCTSFLKYEVGKRGFFSYIFRRSYNDKFSIVWEDPYLSSYLAFQVDEKTKLLVNRKFNIPQNVKVLSVYNLEDGNTLVWTIAKGQAYNSFSKNFVIYKINQSGDIAETYNYFDFETLFNSQSSLKFSYIYELKDRVCLSTYYEIDYYSKVYSEHKWDLKCIRKSVFQNNVNENKIHGSHSNNNFISNNSDSNNSSMNNNYNYNYQMSSNNGSPDYKYIHQSSF